jgi:hypothetical protein
MLWASECRIFLLVIERSDAPVEGLGFTCFHVLYISATSTWSLRFRQHIRPARRTVTMQSKV